MSSDQTDKQFERSQRLTDVSRSVNRGSNVPRDAATLMLIDRSQDTPHILVGQRHRSHAFMPGLYVFPGGQVEACDFDAPAVAELSDEVSDKLSTAIRPYTELTARAIALAAIRETFEECAILLGAPAEAGSHNRYGETWRRFYESGLLPDLSAIQFVGRAIGPPGVRHRFDARFLALDVAAVTQRVDRRGPLEEELVDAFWVSLAEARTLPMPTITGIMLEEFEDRLDSGFDPAQAAAYFHMEDGTFVRETI